MSELTRQSHPQRERAEYALADVGAHGGVNNLGAPAWPAVIWAATSALTFALFDIADAIREQRQSEVPGDVG